MLVGCGTPLVLDTGTKSVLNRVLQVLYPHLQQVVPQMFKLALEIQQNVTVGVV